MRNLMKKFYLSFVIIIVGLTALPPTSSIASSAKSYYMSVDGSDENSGTLKAPFASIAKAQEVASSGDTVYILGGTYKNFKFG